MVLDFVVSGTPRSGTGYTAALLGAFGYPMGHEVLRDYGISSWCWAVDTGSVPTGVPRDGRSQDFLIHAVRNPFDVFCSLVTTCLPSPEFLEFVGRWVEIDDSSDLAVAGSVIVGWNRLVASLSPDLVFRVEDDPWVLGDFLMSRGYPVVSFPRFPSRSFNTRDYSLEFDPSVLRFLSSDLLVSLGEHAERYGYEWPPRT